LFARFTTRFFTSLQTAESGSPGAQASRPFRPLSLLIALSGMAALGWQFVWTYQFGLLLGHEFVAVLAVMAAFLGGLSLGAFAFHNTLSQSAKPQNWFVLSEVVIALWGLIVVFALPHLGPSISQWIGSEPSVTWHWLIAFSVPFLLLLPASLAMGLTVPALELSQAKSLARLYSFNTLGAVLGVFLIVFVAVPLLGIQGSALLCAAANLLSALLCWHWGKAASVSRVEHASENTRIKTSLAFFLFATGLLGVGYQVLVVRVLSQVHENTVFSYALVLTVYLLGTAIGSYRRPKHDGTNSVERHSLTRLMSALLIALTGSAIALWWADVWVTFPERALDLNPSLRIASLQGLAPLVGEFFVGLVALFLPSALMARVFTRLCELSKANSQSSVGKAFAINTLGAALAPPIIAVLIYPSLGAGYSLLAISICYSVLTFAARHIEQDTREASPEGRTSSSFGPRFAYGLLAGLGILALSGLSSQRPLRFVSVPQGGQLVKYEDGILASVSIVRDALGVDRLHINNREQEGSSAQSAIETKLGLIPILLHPAPGRALFLGYGTGYTATTAAKDTALKVTAIELLPEVIAASGTFQDANDPRAKERLKIINADGRRFIQAGTDQYDVIVADLFHPARHGAGAIYTREHFVKVRERLAPEGIFCQWLALHQMELSTLQSIIAAYLHAFPNTVAVLASNSLDTPVIGLISKGGAPPNEALFDLSSVEQRLRTFPDQTLLKQAKLESAVAVLGTLIADSPSLKAWSAHQQLNSDDHPIVIHEAPWATYHPESTARDRLFAFLAASKTPTSSATSSVVRTKDPQALQPLLAYWKAREEHLKLGKHVRAEDDPEKMLNQIQVPMLAILASSPNFQPAFEPLMALASALAPNNRTRAIEVFQALKTIRPNDSQITQAIESLKP
jgi:spermidine synthase